jgi:hypothetical protein
MIVQQGKVEFAWEPAAALPEPTPAGTPSVQLGDSSAMIGAVLPGSDNKQTLYPGDWITLDRRVQFSYRNVGGDSAIIVKAVWARNLGGTGCGGGCK